MDLKFYPELSDGCPSNVDTEFMDTQGYDGYSEENKVTSRWFSCVDMKLLSCTLVADILNTGCSFQKSATAT